MEEWANGKLGSRSMIFLIFGLNNKELEYEGIKRQVILKVKLISKLKNIDTITYVWQAIRKEVVRPNPICVSPRCVRAKKHCCQMLLVQRIHSNKSEGVSLVQTSSICH